MKRIIIFGNSGSGKSTLSKAIYAKLGIAHLDLDTLAWKATSPPERMETKDSKLKIDKFLNTHEQWVIEGCYSDLIELISESSNEVVFMDLSIERCIENAKMRPWEPHKYASKDEQDANLSMLIDWISEYENREDTFSRKAHLKIFEEYKGSKIQISSNEDAKVYLQGVGDK